MEKAEKKAVVGKFDEAIKNYKKRGVETYILTCESGEECLLRQPTVKETGKILPYLTPMQEGEKPDLGEAGIKIVDLCWVAGDDAIRKDENLLYEVALGASTLVNLKIADVKKN